MQTVAVGGDTIEAVCSCSLPFQSASDGAFRKGSYQRAVASGFFIVLPGDVNRGHHPPLANVGSTDADKNGESSVCLLGEHPSGQRKLEPAMVNRDKRENLSHVDNMWITYPQARPRVPDLWIKV